MDRTGILHIAFLLCTAAIIGMQWLSESVMNEAIKVGLANIARKYNYSR